MDTQYPILVPDSQYLIPSTGYPVLDTWYWIPGIGYPVLDTQYPVLDTQYPIRVAPFPIPGRKIFKKNYYLSRCQETFFLPLKNLIKFDKIK
jgi:hypothetical protein